MLLDKIKPYAKAITAFVTPGVVALGAAVQDGTPDGSNVAASEWVAIAIAMLTTGSLVFAVPNKDPRALHQEESVQPPTQIYGGKHEATYHDGK